MASSTHPTSDDVHLAEEVEAERQLLPSDEPPATSQDLMQPQPTQQTAVNTLLNLENPSAHPPHRGAIQLAAHTGYVYDLAGRQHYIQQLFDHYRRVAYPSNIHMIDMWYIRLTDGQYWNGHVDINCGLIGRLVIWEYSAGINTSIHSLPDVNEAIPATAELVRFNYDAYRDDSMTQELEPEPDSIALIRSTQTVQSRPISRSPHRHHG